MTASIALRLRDPAAVSMRMLGLVVSVPAMLATEAVWRRDPQRKRPLHGKNARPRRGIARSIGARPSTSISTPA